jgi:hypothetical protein
MFKCQPPVPVNMTLFGNRALADIFLLIYDHAGLEQALNPTTGVFIRERTGSFGQRGDTGRRAM